MTQQTQRAKKSKKPDKRPARSRYWRERRLVKNKIRKLMKQRVYVGREKRMVRGIDKDGNPTDQFVERSMPIRDKNGDPITKPRFESKKEAEEWWVCHSGKTNWGPLHEWAMARKRVYGCA